MSNTHNCLPSLFERNATLYCKTCISCRLFCMDMFICIARMQSKLKIPSTALTELLVSRNGFRGRPAYIISKVQLETLIELGFDYNTIARMLGVSERTILRRRVEFGLPVGCTFTDITDDDLDNAVRGILQVCEMVAMADVCMYSIFKHTMLSLSHIYTHTCTLSVN